MHIDPMTFDDIEIDSCTPMSIVPKDASQPVYGPFMIVDGESLRILKLFARDIIGITEDQYELRVLDDMADDLFNYSLKARV